MESYTTSPAESRRRALRGLLLRLGGYGRLNVETIVRHVDVHGSAESCLNVRYADRDRVNRLVAAHNAMHEPADFWPDETDAWRWEPTAAEQAEAAALFAEGGIPCA
jgi:hypothetical protein